MAVKTIIFNNTSNNCSQLSFPYDPLVETTQAMIDTLSQTNLDRIDASITQFDYIENITLPSDTYFSASWIYDPITHTVVTDMPIARTIHLEVLKKKRILKWEAMGAVKNQNVALDSGFTAGEQTDLASLRALENLDLSSYTTEATLKAYIPSYLVI